MNLKSLKRKEISFMVLLYFSIILLVGGIVFTCFNVKLIYKIILIIITISFILISGILMMYYSDKHKKIINTMIREYNLSHYKIEKKDNLYVDLYKHRIFKIFNVNDYFKGCEYLNYGDINGVNFIHYRGYFCKYLKLLNILLFIIDLGNRVTLFNFHTTYFDGDYFVFKYNKKFNFNAYYISEKHLLKNIKKDFKKVILNDLIIYTNNEVLLEKMINLEFQNVISNLRRHFKYVYFGIIDDEFHIAINNKKSILSTKKIIELNKNYELYNLIITELNKLINLININLK